MPGYPAGNDIGGVIPDGFRPQARASPVSDGAQDQAGMIKAGPET